MADIEQMISNTDSVVRMLYGTLKKDRKDLSDKNRLIPKYRNQIKCFIIAFAVFCWSLVVDRINVNNIPTFVQFYKKRGLKNFLIYFSWFVIKKWIVSNKLCINNI